MGWQGLNWKEYQKGMMERFKYPQKAFGPVYSVGPPRNAQAGKVAKL